MIAEFSVENFKSIEDKVTLSLKANKNKDLKDYYILKPNNKERLLKIAIIYGPNASGKTNILLALQTLKNLIVNPANKKDELLNIDPFALKKDKPTKFSLEFYINNVKYLYLVSANNKTILQENLYNFSPNKSKLFERTTDTKKQLSKIKFGKKINLNPKEQKNLELNTLWNNTVIGAYNKVNIDNEILQNVYNWFYSKVNPLFLPDSDLTIYTSKNILEDQIDKTLVIKLLKKADFNIDDIKIKELPITELVKDANLLSYFVDLISTKKEFENDDDIAKLQIPETSFIHNIQGRGKFELKSFQESSGTQRFYQMAGLLALMIKNQLIFPIDELESSLHPDLIKYFLLTFLVNSNSQIITTTHYRELLLEKHILRNDVIWFTDIKPNGSSDLFSLNDFETSTIRKSSSYYNAYKIGKLGAVPNIDDYFLD